MAVETRSVARREIDLPPPFTLRTLREAGDAFAAAEDAAAETGAGTLVWVRRFDLVEFAVVLEPEEPLALARLVFYAAMNALADAVAATCPPERPLEFAWPDALRFDGGLLGGGRLSWPSGAAEHLTPDWLVFGAMLRASTIDAGEPGEWKQAVSLEDTGFFEGVDSGDIVESFARHLMANLHAWSEAGARAAAAQWLQRYPPQPGVRHSIDANGDFLTHRQGRIERRLFLDALSTPSWLDPERGEPWL